MAMIADLMVHMSSFKIKVPRIRCQSNLERMTEQILYTMLYYNYLHYSMLRFEMDFKCDIYQSS